MTHTFSGKPIGEKIGILKFLQEQEISGVRFECKNTIISFLQKRNISHEEIFMNKELKFLGKIISISPDEVLTIKHINGKNISIPMDHLENVLIRKE